MTSPDTPTTTRTRLMWIMAGLAVIAAGSVFMRLYQPPRLYDQYLPPMRSFLAAAIQADSAALVSLGASARAVNWGLQAGREQPRALRELASGLGASWGGPTKRPAGDSILVLFRGRRDGICYARPMMVSFAGPPSHAQVLEVTADCLAP